MATKAGPRFIKYLVPVLEALRELGGSGRPSEIIDYITTNHSHLIDETDYESLKDGTYRLNKNIHWVRFYLSKAGYIDGSQRGVWTLTEIGQKTPLREVKPLQIFTEVQSLLTQRSDSTTLPLVTERELKAESTEELDHRDRVRRIFNEFSPSGFERFCQLLLRESGFEKVIVTGRTGDGGIDGHGVLRLNHFVSFNVAFQSKRYSDTVGASVIRDFRGSIMGRADKGIILTTGSFTSDARKEAGRDGATPIELVDGEQLIAMLEELELGLIKKRTITVYEVNEEFFRDYKN